jgi:hypothetical protein
MAIMYVLRDVSNLFWPPSSSIYALATLAACICISYLLAKFLWTRGLRLVTGY